MALHRAKRSWTYSAAARAAERHLGFPVGAPLSPSQVPEQRLFYEKAAQTILSVASGAGWHWYAGCRLGRGNNPTTGLEARLVAEVAHAVSGMKSDEANELIKKIHACYADHLNPAPEGKTFGELYDIQKVQPLPEYLDLYKQVKEELARLGVPFK